MAGASRESLAVLLAAQRAESIQPGTPDSLIAVARLLNGSTQLRRSLGDSTYDAEGKRLLVHSLLEGKIVDRALATVTEAVGMRWSSPLDLVDAFVTLAVDASLGLAEQDGTIDETEHALHWFARGIRHNPQVRALLTQRTMADVDKSSLVDDLLNGRAPEQAVWLMRAIVSAPRRPVIESAFNEIFRMAAERRRSQYADVRTATPLTDDQVARLSAVLERLIGRPVQIGVTIDPSVLGGLRVHVGDLVFDGTTSARLELARRSLVAS